MALPMNPKLRTSIAGGLDRCVPIRLLVVLLALTLPLPAQAKGPCKSCRGTEWVKCRSPKHALRRTCGIKSEHLCTDLARATCCQGWLEVPCPSCAKKATRDTWKERKQARRAWVKKVREIDLKVGGRFGHVQTRDVIVHCSLPEWRLDRIGNRKRVHVTHVFAERLQAVADRFHEVVGQRPAKPVQIVLLTTLDEMVQATQVFMPKLGARKAPFRQVIDGIPTFFTFPVYEDLYFDKGLHSHLLHNTVHLIVHSNWKSHASLPAWLDCGLAHWFEIDRFKGAKRCSTFCLARFAPNRKWGETKRWPKVLRKHIDDADFRKLALKKPLDDSGHREHAFYWSAVSFLISKYPKRFKDFYAALAASHNDPKTWEATLRLSMPAFEKAWKRHCKSGRLR